MYTMGIDVGSSSSKVVILKDGKEIVASSVAQVGTGTSGPEQALNEALTKSNLTRDDISATVATGYGRFSFPDTDRQISEISCHAKGVHFQFPNARTIIDIGGQDAKAIRIDKNGTVKQFFMNDKCAAGTGRFLDVMSRVLELTVSDLADYSKRAEFPASISSTCTVFAESEVISQLSKGEKKENIIAGIHKSVASKALALAYRGTIEEDIVMSGGVALNAGVVAAMEEQTGMKITVAKDPQTIGALGAALFAYEEVLKRS
jgi:predicted CoA-substrate-specific enzyme activase